MNDVLGACRWELSGCNKVLTTEWFLDGRAMNKVRPSFMLLIMKHLWLVLRCWNRRFELKQAILWWCYWCCSCCCLMLFLLLLLLIWCRRTDCFICLFCANSFSFVLLRASLTTHSYWNLILSHLHTICQLWSWHYSRGYHTWNGRPEVICDRSTILWGARVCVSIWYVAYGRAGQGWYIELLMI